MEANINLTRGTEVDARGCAVSGASSTALEAFEQALALSLSWRSGADVALAPALREAPGFVMAHVLQAYLLLCSRDPARVQSARPVLMHTASLHANERERMHLGAIAAVLPAWSQELPGYHAVLAMRAFGLVESGAYEHAEQAAGAALELDPLDARAHHVMAHVFEMSERPDAGMQWMGRHSAGWGRESVVATHCWWHVGLFHLSQGRIDLALKIYDERIRAGHSGAIADLIDASALLWRVRLHGGDAGARWAELAAAWDPHIYDRFCSFNDLHAMLAFVGAGDWDRARRLERALARCQSQPTRHAWTTRMLGLPACRALMAFGRGNDTLALTLLASLPAQAHRLGGSHAQRDVLHLTMLQTIENLRRPRRKPAPANAAARIQPACTCVRKIPFDQNTVVLVHAQRMRPPQAAVNVVRY